MFSYITDDHEVAYAGDTKEEAVRVLTRDAEKYFTDNPEYAQYRMCLVDWDNNKSTVYVFEQERKITCTAY